jgi:hypothetical protein
VDPKDLIAAVHLREVHLDLAVEPTGSEEGRVEDLGPVGCGHEDHAAVRLEAVHLREQLLQGLLLLLVTRYGVGKTGACLADRVDLIDEDDRWGAIARLLEEISHASCSQSDEELDELRRGYVEERNAGCAGDRAGKQRLAGAGWAHQQNALRDLGAYLFELVGIAKVVHELLELGLDLVHARDVLEGRLQIGAVVELRLVLTERQRSLRPAHLGAQSADDEEVVEEADREERQQRYEEFGPQTGLVAADVHTGFIQFGHEFGGVEIGGERRGEPLRAGAPVDLALHRVGGHRYLCDAVFLDQIAEARIADLLHAGGVELEEREYSDSREYPEDRGPALTAGVERRAALSTAWVGSVLL